MLVARQLVRKLKGRNDIPIVPGAIGPAAQILNPTATWFDDTNVKTIGKKGSFEQACGNQGVDLMRETLLSAGGFETGGPVTILAIGLSIGIESGPPIGVQKGPL